MAMESSGDCKRFMGVSLRLRAHFEGMRCCDSFMSENG